MSLLGLRWPLYPTNVPRCLVAKSKFAAERRINEAWSTVLYAEGRLELVARPSKAAVQPPSLLRSPKTCRHCSRPRHPALFLRVYDPAGPYRPTEILNSLPEWRIVSLRPALASCLCLPSLKPPPLPAQLILTRSVTPTFNPLRPFFACVLLLCAAWHAASRWSRPRFPPTIAGCAGRPCSPG